MFEPFGIDSSVCTIDVWPGCKAYCFTADGYGIFNVRIHLGTYRPHEGGLGTNKFAQELTRRERRNCPSPYPARGSNPGSSAYYNPDALTIEPRPPSGL